MITDYMNNTATWKAVTSVNEYNEPTTSSTTIYCRMQFKRRLVRDKNGVEVVSEATMYTESAINVGDIITYNSVDWVVLTVAPMANLDGITEYYEVTL